MPNKNFDNNSRPLATVMEALHFLHEWMDGRSYSNGELRLKRAAQPHIKTIDVREGDSGGSSSWEFRLLVTEEVIRNLKGEDLIIGKPYMGGRDDDRFVISEKGKKYYSDNFSQMSDKDKEEFRDRIFTVKYRAMMRSR